MPNDSKSPDFLLMVGGPMYELLQRLRLLRAPLGLLQRRALVLPLIAWLPLLLLTAFAGRLLPGQGYVSFLQDIEAHVRLLVALPLLFAAELPAHRRVRSTIRQLIERDLVPADQRTEFEAALHQAGHILRSPFVEAAVLVLVVTAGHWLWRSQIAYGGTSWYAFADGAGFTLTLPGWWYACVAIPMFQFVAFRWYVRLLIWFWLLLRISRLRLNLVPTHADRAAGLAFVGNSSYAFSLLLLAHGALLAGWIADRVVHSSASALDFVFQSVVLVGCVIAFIVGPLGVFAFPLASAARRGRGEYGLLVTQYAQAFDRKWIHGERPPDEPMLGSGDMQSLADLATAYGLVQETRWVPFGPRLVIELSLITAAPLLPLAFTILPFRNLLLEAFKILL